MSGWLLRRRAALGLRPAIVPVSVYIPLGFLIGPRVAGVMSADTLAHLDAAVAVALATLGVFVGLALARAAQARRLIAAAALESSITIIIVTGAITFLLVKWQIPDVLTPAALAMALAICAAASAAGAAESGLEEDSIAARIADLDDVVPIVASAFVIPWLATADPIAGVRATTIAVALGVLAGAIGWLLFERADGAGERAVFVLGTLTMLGGGAAYVDASPLVAGLVAGLVWHAAPGQADRIIADDVRKFHHPLVLLLLITAGARLSPSLVALWLFVPFVAFRMTGKIAGGWAASRLVRGAPADILGAYLVPPGVVGTAIALNVVQRAPEAGAPLLVAATLGAIVFEFLAAVVAPRVERR